MKLSLPRAIPALLLAFVLIACGAGGQAAPQVPTAAPPRLAPAAPTAAATVQLNVPLVLTAPPSAT
ncbi:MAG: hypothetical protein ACJ8CR_08810, partial [Roseiflexaceae bacterium]